MSVLNNFHEVKSYFQSYFRCLALLILVTSCNETQSEKGLLTVDSVKYSNLLSENAELKKINNNLAIEIEENNRRFDSLVQILPALETINKFKNAYYGFGVDLSNTNRFTLAISSSVRDSSESFNEMHYKRLLDKVQLGLFSTEYYNTTYEKNRGEVILNNAGYSLYNVNILDSNFAFDNVRFIPIYNYKGGGSFISVWKTKGTEIRFEGFVDIKFFGGDNSGFNEIDKIYELDSGSYSTKNILLEMSRGNGDEGYGYKSKRLGILTPDLHLEIIYEETCYFRWEGAPEGFLKEDVEFSYDFENKKLTATKIDRKQDGKEVMLKSTEIDLRPYWN